LTETILGWIFALILAGVLVRSLVEIITPLLPFIGLGLLGILAISGAIWWRNRNW